MKKEKKDKEQGIDIEEEDTQVVVTIRCIDMASPISNVDKVPCSECGEMTWVSVSFRNKKIDKVVCEPCFFKNDIYKHKDSHACVTEECLNEAFNWAKQSGYKVTKEDMIKNMEEKIGKKLTVVKQKE